VGELTSRKRGGGAVKLTGERSLWRGSPATVAACVLFFVLALAICRRYGKIHGNDSYIV
jgi:hypothetical protein